MMTPEELHAFSKTIRGESRTVPGSYRRSERETAPEDARELRRILNAVCRLRHVRPERVMSKERTEHISFNRQMAMYVARKITKLSFPKLGDFFMRDHTTVMYGCNMVAAVLKDRPVMAEEVARLIQGLAEVRDDAGRDSIATH